MSTDSKDVKEENKKGEVIVVDINKAESAKAPADVVQRLAKGDDKPASKEEVEKKLKEAEDRRTKLHNEKAESAAEAVAKAKKVAEKQKEEEKKTRSRSQNLHYRKT